MRLRTRLPAVLFAAAGVLLLGGLAPIALHGNGGGTTVPGAGAAPADPLDAGIAAAQARLRRLPGDWNTWAQLGSAYVERARVTGDPTYYGKAEEALHRSLDLAPATNWAAMAGMGSLANARHDFHAALDWGRRAERINPAAGSVHGVIADALTQLGDAPGARTAVQRMLDVEPGVSSFTRASYDFEQHGQTEPARAALERALAEAAAPADRAFCRYYLGELAFNTGDAQGALVQYDAGLTADPGYHPLHAGRGKAYLALGRTADALHEYELATQALPLPNLVAEYGDALTVAGRLDAARQQYALHAVQQKLFAAGGVGDRLGDAVFLADHGDPAGALTAARAEWADRQPALVADALAWALHRNGQDTEALTYATKATALGWRNATFLYHRGAIEHALGNDADARRDLADALAVNPHFDALQAPAAQQLLTSIGGRP
ncbi:tetratricopeptide repeat protein [Dactylosporangium vinaceum]|uniref:Tetratricopeptide repeat protein n=1 Tax=Dactylosporangium vinaceum TaxID=53362 RepID=A0ABV5M5F7_9ACTN|nr:tetratricopeptide repeat protein [Dactylosporangium vinaceum]